MSSMSSAANNTAAGAVERSRARRAKASGSSVEDKIRSVPARFMSPGLLLVAVAAVLVVFGIVMIFSASSIRAASETGDAAYYLKHQALYAVIGLAFAAVIALVDYHWFCGAQGALVVSALSVLALLAVLAVGTWAGGAKRWIDLGIGTLQPSELSKLAFLFTGASLLTRYFDGGRSNAPHYIALALLYIAVPGALILAEPDKGTTAIVGVLCFILVYVSGLMSPRTFRRVLFAAAVVALIVLMVDDYSRERFLSFFSQASDTSDSNYQINQGFISFGSGGLIGRGLGMSRQKYFFLPEAHTDFIFAIIGEELGLVGTLFVVAMFALIGYFGLTIARNAPDLSGRLVATGAVTLLLSQFFLNALGVLGLFPLSGKPMPFLTYGGSSLLSSMGLIAAIVNVAMRSKLPETEHDRRRRQISLFRDEDTGVGEARARGSAESRAMGQASRERGNVPLAGRSAGEASGGLKLVDGGSRGSGRASASRGAAGTRQRPDARMSRDASGRTRIDLGPTGAQRLRPDSGPTVRGTDSRGARSSERPKRRS